MEKSLYQYSPIVISTLIALSEEVLVMFAATHFLFGAFQNK
jgi:hypothetical protein